MAPKNAQPPMLAASRKIMVHQERHGICYYLAHCCRKSHTDQHSESLESVIEISAPARERAGVASQLCIAETVDEIVQNATRPVKFAFHTNVTYYEQVEIDEENPEYLADLFRSEVDDIDEDQEEEEEEEELENSPSGYGLLRETMIYKWIYNLGRRFS